MGWMAEVWLMWWDCGGAAMEFGAMGFGVMEFGTAA